VKAPAARKPATKRRLPDLERDTPIVAIAAARAVIEARSAGLAHPLPDTLARQLARRAKLHYRNNAVFRRRLNAPGDRGRDTLHAFMHHWLDGEFADTAPAARVGG
jgi:hypothetical protein